MLSMVEKEVAVTGSSARAREIAERAYEEARDQAGPDAFDRLMPEGAACMAIDWVLQGLAGHEGLRLLVEVLRRLLPPTTAMPVIPRGQDGFGLVEHLQVAAQGDRGVTLKIQRDRDHRGHVAVVPGEVVFAAAERPIGVIGGMAAIAELMTWSPVVITVFAGTGPGRNLPRLDPRELTLRAAMLADHRKRAHG